MPIGLTDPVVLTPVGALLYAAHTAISARRATIAKEHIQATAREGRTRLSAGADELHPWTRYFELSALEIARVEPRLKLQAKVIGNMLLTRNIWSAVPGNSAQAIGMSEVLSEQMIQSHGAQTETINLRTMTSLPDDRERSTDALLRAAALLATPPGLLTATRFDDDLRRLADAEGAAAKLTPDLARARADGWLDIAERELEDAVTVDLSEAASRVRLTRRELEGLVRAKVLPERREKKRMGVTLGELRHALGLPFVFPHAATPRIDGTLTFPTGEVHLVLGGSLATGIGEGSDGYLEFVPHNRALARSLARLGSTPINIAKLGLDATKLSTWARMWSRDRCGRELHLAREWNVIAGKAHPDDVQSVGVFNALGNERWI